MFCYLSQFCCLEFIRWKNTTLKQSKHKCYHGGEHQSLQSSFLVNNQSIIHPTYHQKRAETHSAVLPILLSHRDKAVSVDGALSWGQNGRLLQLLGGSTPGYALQETQLPEVLSNGLWWPQAVPGLVNLGWRLRHLNLQVAFVLQIHGGSAGVVESSRALSQ